MSINTSPSIPTSEEMSIFNDIASSSSSSAINASELPSTPNDMASMDPSFTGAITKDFYLSKMRTVMSLTGSYTLATPLRPVNTDLIARVHALLNPILVEHPTWLSASAYNVYLASAESATEKCYTVLPIENKVYIAVQTFFFFYIDDGVEKTPSLLVPDLQDLWHRLLTPGPMNMANPWLSFFFAYMHSETKVHYGDYMAMTILTGTMDFVTGNLVEGEFPNGFSHAKPVDFPRWLRRKDGNSECFIAFLFSKVLFPDELLMKERVLPAMNGMVDWMDCGNDILSFYKESIVGNEENTHFTNEARVCGVGLEVVLEDWCEKIVGVWVASMDQLGDGLEGRIFAKFVHGVFMFHISCPRYRLAELGLKHPETA